MQVKFCWHKISLSEFVLRYKIDYLFIDEAGQVSLADLISIGNIAKNIVLIGDQTS